MKDPKPLRRWNLIRRRRLARGWRRIYGDTKSPDVVDPVTWKSDAQLLAEADLWDSVGCHDTATAVRSVVVR